MRICVCIKHGVCFGLGLIVTTEVHSEHATEQGDPVLPRLNAQSKSFGWVIRCTYRQVYDLYSD